MKLLSPLFAFSLLFTACTASQHKDNNIPLAISGTDTSKEKTAYFAEGCFWHTEIVFQSLAGVSDAVSGYAGGEGSNPDYESVSTGTTGYAETVAVHYDPSIVSFESLVKAFFASHDPTTLNRQGHDEGTQYRSIAFYSNASEKETIEKEIALLQEEKKYAGSIVTEVLPLQKFYPAEDYHQEYISHHPDNPYVQHVSIPDFEAFRRTFKGNFKQ